MPKVKKVKSISQLKKIADRVFSIWIRRRDGRCVTCGSRENLQCGHYESRSFNELRYCEFNAHAQCVGCNVFKRGNMTEYARFMIRTYGEEILDQLARRKRVIKQFKPSELLAIIAHYKI